MDERRVADYFVVAGLPGQDDNFLTDDNNESNKLEDWCQEGTHLKDTHMQAPITDLAIIFPALGESCPEDYVILTKTVTGFPADLNHGSLRTNECYICYKRGRDKPPLVDIGVIYDGKERIMPDAEVVSETPDGHVANVNNSTSRIFVTYRRASSKMPCNSLVVTDICLILANKGECQPHAFCVINKNLNKGMLGSDVFLCYKKSMNRANLISFKPAILYKYPVKDYDSFMFPNSVAMFCLPMGATIECWPKLASKPKPVFSTFVLTVADAAQKIYGSAITFYEEIEPVLKELNDTNSQDILELYTSKENSNYDDNTEDSTNTGNSTEEIKVDSLKPRNYQKLGIFDKLNPSQIEKLQFADPNTQSLNISKSICILSHWPFFDTFEKFLVFLHSMVNGKEQNVPIEKYIAYFLCDIPFPSPQRPRILVQLSGVDRLILTQPEDLALPRSGASFRQLLINLGPDNCLLILLLILTEQKILVHSLRPDVLTSVSEAIAMILFPFKWQCPYIPLCPLGLAEVLHAPLPFLIGVDSRFFDLYDPPADVNCVDLDTNNVAICDDKRYLNLKLLPKKAARSLKNRLELLYSKLISLGRSYTSQKEKGDADFSVDREFQQKRKEQALELEIQDAFLRFMALILKGYRSYLLPITKAPTVGSTDPTSLFNMQAFLRSRDKAHAKFYSMLVRTQMFIRFIEERSFVSDMDMAGLAFFDECTERVEEESGPLLELDESQHSERTVFIPPPEAGSNQKPLIYKTFKLNPELMRPQKNLSLKNPALSAFSMVPGSPMARRTKHEIKVAQKMARKQAAVPERWARCLLGTCYSLWFLHLPAMLQASSQPAAILHQAYELLVKMQKLRLDPTEEVCYRAMMQLCGVYGQPVLAVKLLFHMKRSGVQPNALTYGFYNKAVLEATWPSDMTNSSQLMWNKLRNVIVGAALFKRAGKKGARRRLSGTTDILGGDSKSTETLEHALSRSSLDSTHSQDLDAAGSDSLIGSSVPDLPVFALVDRETKMKFLRQNSIVKDQGASLSTSQPEALNRSPSDPRLVRNSESPLKSPIRTPVTENDPLGALLNDETPVVSPSGENDSNCSTSTLTILNNVTEERAGGPLLFRSNVLPRSATFHQAVDEGGPIVGGHLQRSETMPHSVAQQGEQERDRDRMEFGSLWAQNKDSVTSSLSSLGSSLKLSFGRYSTGGLTFAKNKELISSNQLIESLSLSSYISPSSLTGKKSNELILGGLNSLKSAATSVAKKFDEIKEAISATSTPVKSKEREQKLTYGISHESLDSLTDGSQQDRNEIPARVSGDLSADLGSLSELADCLYPRGSKELEERMAIELVLSTASRCHHCAAIIYDEEIMAGWQPEDSNLNTVCQFCDKATVPLLTVTILDYRCEEGESNDPLTGALFELLEQPKELEDPITVPYLNPLVLRKELESVLSQEGDSCLTKHKFIQEHPIVYWNLIWYFERINLSSHLPELWFNNSQDLKNKAQSNPGLVGVRTLWDNEKLHMDRLPMYIQWKTNSTEDRTLMQAVIGKVRCNDLAEPIRRLAMERHKNQTDEKAPISIYRDILFLVFTVLGRGNIDQGAFDREYNQSLERLTEKEEKLLLKTDAPPTTMALYCRHYFKPLNNCKNMPATLAFFGRVQRKILPCGVPIDPDTCPCSNVKIIPPSSHEEESVGRGEHDPTSVRSCQSLNKLTTDNIEVSIYLDRVFSIFCQTLQKLELSASLQILLVHPELPHILNKEDFKLIVDAFYQYIHIEPCTWPCSESLEVPESTSESLKSISSSTNLGNFNLKIYQAIQILNSYKEVREMAKQLCPEYSEQSQLFLGYVKYFIEHSLKRMHISPEEYRNKDLYYRKVWRDNEKAKTDIRTLTVALDEQRKQHDTKMELINAQCEKDSATVKRINKKCKEDIKYTVIKSEREMMMMYKASEIKQKEIREDVINAESHLKTIRASNLALEKEARDKRFKIESQLLGVINKYDTEIGEQQKQMEYLIAEFEADKKKKQDLEAEIENQAELYNALMKERQEASEAIFNEKLAKLVLTRVAKIIQRWWRGIKEKRKAKIGKLKKKNTKNKKKK